MKRDNQPDMGAIGLNIALNDAMDDDGEVDPSAKALLEKQVRMLDLQMRNLRKETQQLGVKFLRERLHAAFELAIAAAIVLAVLVVLLIAWNAWRSEGLTIQPLAAPPDLQAKGITGPVLASRLSDALGDIDAATTSVRAGGPVRATQPQEVKVEIPNTGLSLGEVDALLRGWLGHETPVTGEVTHDAGRLSLTIRVGDKPGVTLYGADTELDQLIRSAAEQVLAKAEPYRYAVYLQSQNRQVEALAAAQTLASAGPPGDRAWGYAIWGRLLASAGDFQGASAKARRAIALDPTIAAAYDNLAAAQRLLGHDQAAVEANRQALAVLRKQKRQMDQVSGPARLATAEGRVAEAAGDFGAAAGAYARAVRLGGLAHAAQAAAALPRALALDHDLAGAREALDDIRGQLPEDAVADAALAPAIVALQAQDFAGAETILHKAEAMALMFGQAGGAVRATQIAPLLAYAELRQGRIDAAALTVAAAPADAYAAVRVRAAIAAARGDFAEAERQFGVAVAIAPGLAGAWIDWARAELAAGRIDLAIDRARKAAALAPADADPLVVWGEALMKKGDLAGADARFKDAGDLSPRWGLPPLRRAQILVRKGERAAADRELDVARSLNLTAAERAELAAARR